MLKDAKRELEKVANFISNNIIIYKMLGDIHEKEGNREDAARFYRIFSAYGSEDSEVNGILNSLEKPFSKEIEETSDNKIKISTNTIAEIYIKQGHLKRALEIYRDILAADPENTAIQNKIQDLMERIKGSDSTEVDLPLYSSKTGRIINTLNKWLSNLQKMTNSKAQMTNQTQSSNDETTH
ncbi:MAG: tetratricopeptide repeat protein [Desulfobacterales bacterium]|nr:tetratricopeptide repeat protein [Desulfobacterales bacterium]